MSHFSCIQVNLWASKINKPWNLLLWIQQVGPEIQLLRSSRRWSSSSPNIRQEYLYYTSRFLNDIPIYDCFSKNFFRNKTASGTQLVRTDKHWWNEQAFFQRFVSSMGNMDNWLEIFSLFWSTKVNFKAKIDLLLFFWATFYCGCYNVQELQFCTILE